MNINPQIINGSWRYGIALDWHTVSSIPLLICYNKNLIMIRNFL